jgi:hypothetical protein
MGTRGLLGFIIQARRHGIYNHWDSYPSALGKIMVDFLLSLKPEDYAKMDALVKEITLRTPYYHIVPYEMPCIPYVLPELC